MRIRFLILGAVAGTFVGSFYCVRAQVQQESGEHRQSLATGQQTIDGIAARIEGEILTESEVRELSAFQQLVDGQAKPRAEVLKELANQWIVEGEARAAKYPEPTPQDIDRAYAQLTKQFTSPAEFAARCNGYGLSQIAVRRLLGQQLYLSRFLDYRFRPAAQVTSEQTEAYYKNEFSPQLKAKSETVPPLADVEDTIREVLVQRDIDSRATQWLDETRDRVKIETTPAQGAK